MKLNFKEERQRPWTSKHWVAEITEGRVIVDFDSHIDRRWYFYTIFTNSRPNYNSLREGIDFDTKEQAMEAAQKWMDDNAEATDRNHTS